MASPKTLLLRELKRHIYLPLVDKDDPRVLHTTSGSYFRMPNGQIVQPDKPINGRARKLAKKRRAKSLKALNGQSAMQS